MKRFLGIVLICLPWVVFTVILGWPFVVWVSAVTILLACLTLGAHLLLSQDGPKVQ